MGISPSDNLLATRIQIISVVGDVCVHSFGTYFIVGVRNEGGSFFEQYHERSRGYTGTRARELSGEQTPFVQKVLKRAYMLDVEAIRAKGKKYTWKCLR